jgi:uncharacterized repeat protein (TIGR03943 family)
VAQDEHRSEGRASPLPRLLAASPSLLVAALVARLWLTGTLRYYVNDRTVWIVLAGGLLFLIVGIVLLVRRSEPRLSWRILVFAVPALLGLLLPAHPLSALSGQSSSLGALQLASHVSGGSPGDEFGTWIGDLTAHPDPSWWAGQHVTLVGFASGQAGLPARSFILGRYLVTCCVVDATLLGFPVQLDRGRMPPDGAWVQVSGTFGTRYWTDPSGQHYPLIEHARITPVSIPSSPYLSP